MNLLEPSNAQHRETPANRGEEQEGGQVALTGRPVVEPPAACMMHVTCIGIKSTHNQCPTEQADARPEQSSMRRRLAQHHKTHAYISHAYTPRTLCKGQK